MGAAGRELWRCSLRLLSPRSWQAPRADLKRWCDSALAGGQDERAVIGNGNGVLGVGASRAIPAPQGPSVGVGVDLVGAL